MSDTNPSTTTVEAAFTDAAQADRAVARLREHGVPPDGIEVQRGGKDRPDSTASADQDAATRLVRSWFGGVLLGALIGGLVGAVIGAVTFGAATPGFWGLALGAGGGGAGVGALWGMFAGYTSRASRTPRRAAERRDAVRVRVTVGSADADGGGSADPDVVRRIVRDSGGTL